MYGRTKSILAIEVRCPRWTGEAHEKASKGSYSGKQYEGSNVAAGGIVYPADIYRR